MTTDVITKQEALARIELLIRERDLQAETVQCVLDWNRQWQDIAREWAERYRLQINENIELRNKLIETRVDAALEKMESQLQHAEAAQNNQEAQQ